MNTAIAVITALGVLVAIVANMANIARFMTERRERRTKLTQPALALSGTLPTSGAPAPASDFPPVFTPDRRIRVFVSSALGELKAERAAVKEVIGDLRLTPVMFELGARPHPPADLYRAYLAQSDVFVGIYGEHYGWVPPGSQVSGLEDEYLLSTKLPTRLYIKDPAPAREERLEQLLRRIREDGRATYRRYGSPAELAQLLGDDLAVLVTERFHSARLRGEDGGPTAASGLTLQA